MPSRFAPLTVDEFAGRLRHFHFRRAICAVHMHHTWEPNHGDYRGLESIEAMWRLHTEVRGWLDIAQHVTIAPDGTIWTGRDWNRPPASAIGHNGDEHAGPFMLETVGDFDEGHDTLAGPQRAAVLQVIARVQRRFRLPAESLRFHNMMTTEKTCPGTGVAYDQLLAELRAVRAELAAATDTRAWFAWHLSAATRRVAVALRLRGGARA